MVAVARLATLAAPCLALLLGGCGVARVSESDAGAGVCASCHGDAARASHPTAPPFDAQGNASSSAVGAHLLHLERGVTCETCHVVPSSTFAAGHIDDAPAEITFGPAATRGATPPPTYDPSTRECSNTYCHGGSATFVTNVSPAWDAGAAGGCTGCHGAPPASHDAALTSCVSCHSATVQDDTTILAGGLHLNGSADGLGHLDYSGPGVHGPEAIAFLSGAGGALDCTSCHGPDYAGGTSGVSCNGCHASMSTAAFPSGVASWRANCTFCHGTPTEPYPAIANPILAAPPQGVAGATAATDPSVGAHRTHLLGRSANPISDGVACGDCHAVPDTLGHVDGAPAVVTRRPGTATTVGSYGAGTCSSTYCHGNFPNGRTGNAPSWTATSGQAACGTCHSPQWAGGSPGTNTDAHALHDPAVCAACHDDGRPNCSQCHASYSRTTTPPTVNRALHVDGKVDVVTGSTVGWSQATRSCSPGCHSADGDHPGAGSRSW